VLWWNSSYSGYNNITRSSWNYGFLCLATIANGSTIKEHDQNIFATILYKFPLVHLKRNTSFAIFTANQRLISKRKPGLDE